VAALRLENKATEMLRELFAGRPVLRAVVWDRIEAIADDWRANSEPAVPPYAPSRRMSNLTPIADDGQVWGVCIILRVDFDPETVYILAVNAAPALWPDDESSADSEW